MRVATNSVSDRVEKVLAQPVSEDYSSGTASSNLLDLTSFGVVRHQMLEFSLNSTKVSWNFNKKKTSSVWNCGLDSNGCGSPAEGALSVRLSMLLLVV